MRARQSQALAAAFAIRLLLVFLVFVQWGPCLQEGDSQSWMYGSLGLALGRPGMYQPSFFWPPLFKLLAAGLFKGFGFSIVMIKAVETLLGLAGIALAYRLALRLYGASAAFVCALLVALLPIGATLSLSGLAEPLYLVLMEIFFLAYLDEREERDWRLHAAAAGAMALAVVTRYEALGFYAAFAALEARRFLRRRGPRSPARLAAAVLAPAAVFLLWVGVYSPNFDDPFFWFRVTRADNAAGYLHGLGPAALVAYVVAHAWWGYSWFCLAVPAAIAGLWAGAEPRAVPSARMLTAAGLGGMAALFATTAVRLLSSDAARTLYVPFVLLMPGAAFLLARAGERCRRALPKAASAGAAALLAGVFAWHCGGMASERGWCFPDDGGASSDACEVGGTLRRIARRREAAERSMACRAASGDFSCSSAVVCSGLAALAERPPQSPPEAAFYVIGPCARANGALLARAGRECLTQKGAPR
ncbi:MAG: glycosyltransferase family 39 protein [Elusimicrobiota bacterium]